jgi:type II secretory pathway component PulF
MRDIAAKGHNRWLHDRLSKTIFYFSSGYNLGQALEATGTDFPDRELVDDLVIYSELSGFDRILYGLGREWVDNGMERIKQQSSVLNTAAIVFIGAVLGWFTYAVVSIQMSMGSHFSGMGGF